MAEFFRPELRERAALEVIEQTGHEYHFRLNKKVKDTALDILQEDTKLQDGLMRSRERTLFFLSQVSADTEYGGIFVQLSNAVFDPTHVFLSRLKVSKNTIQADISLPEISLEDSRELEEHLKDWSETGLLSSTREKLSITPETESAFDLVVVNTTEEGLFKAEGATAYVTWNIDPEKPIIVFPKLPNENTIHHEYIHTQIRLFPGYGDLGRGLEEGFVESNTPIPKSYPSQRGLFSYIKSVIPCINEILIDSRTNPRARVEFFRSVVKEFGLNGLNYILRASPDPARKAMRFYPSDMYDYVLPPDEVASILGLFKKYRSARIAA